MMDFVQQNYVWFIGGAIFIVLIIIGYVAEQTDFGHKKIEKKVKNNNDYNKKEEVKEPIQEEKLKNIKLSDAVYKNLKTEDKNLAEDEKNIVIDNKEIKPEIKIDAKEIKPEEKLGISKEELEELSVPITEAGKEKKEQIEVNTEKKESKDDKTDSKNDKNQEQPADKMTNEVSEKEEVKEEKQEEVKSASETELKEDKSVWETPTKPKVVKEDVTEAEEDIWDF